MYEILYRIEIERRIVLCVEDASGDFQIQGSKNMSTVTSLVKSGKRKIIKMETVEPVKHERRGIKARQKPPESTGASVLPRGFLGQPDPAGPRSFLGQPDPAGPRNFLGQPDPKRSQDTTRPQDDAETNIHSAEKSQAAAS